MSANQADFPIATVARVFGASEAGCYAWRQRPPSAHAVAHKMLLMPVRAIRASSRQTFGVWRVPAELRTGGERHGRKRIARLMRAAGLVGASRRRTGMTTTRRGKDARPAADLVDRNFVASQPNQLRPADVVHDSDQGSQYTSLAFGNRYNGAGVRPSIGSVGDAYDNATCESFFATLECELLDRRHLASQAEARMACFSFIEGW